MITVLGDVVVDRHLLCRDMGPNPEVAGGRKVRVEDQRQSLGGAGAVARLLAPVEPVTLVGVTGRDPLGQWVARECAQLGISEELWTNPDVVTPLKLRTVVDGRLFGHRLDLETPPVSVPIHIWTCLLHCPLHDALVVADYGKGTCEPSVLHTLSLVARQTGVPIFVDPAYGRPWHLYAGAAVIKANLREAQLALQQTRREGADWNAIALACALSDTYECHVVVTDGGNGIAWAAEGRYDWVDSVPAQLVVDTTGCGDTVLAALVACRHLPLHEACQVAAQAAARQVEHLGVDASVLQSILAGRSGRPPAASPHRALDQVCQPQSAQVGAAKPQA